MESIIQKNDIHILCCLVGSEIFNSSSTFRIYSNIDMRKLLLHLIRLITYLPHGGILIGKLITFGLSLVATRQNSDFLFVLKQSDEVFHMRSFPCSTHCDIAKGDDRDIKRFRL